MERAIDVLAMRMDKVDIRSAVAEEREKQVNEKLSDIKADVEKMTTMVNRVGWLVVATIIASVMKFILEGGLNAGP